MKETDKRSLANNKRARHDYFIEKVFEAGIELKGTEVKSVRQGRVSVKEAYIDIRQGEAWVVNMHISPYEEGNIYNVDPLRDRRLLLHKKEIQTLEKGVTRQGYTVVPLDVHLSGDRVKMDIALAKGKKLYDKREDLKKKDDQRRLEREGY
jgi:SsrA-binding protein